MQFSVNPRLSLLVDENSYANVMEVMEDHVAPVLAHVLEIEEHRKFVAGLPEQSAEIKRGDDPYVVKARV